MKTGTNSSFKNLFNTLFILLCSLTSLAQVAEFDSDKPVVNYNTEYSQTFAGAWDGTKFYAQWEAKDQNIFTATDIAGGYLQFVWIPKRIIMSKKFYDSPYVFEIETDYAEGSSRGGVIIRANPEQIDQVQEPAGGDPGFNREGIAFYPTDDGSKMIVQLTGIYNGDATSATRIQVAKPEDSDNLRKKGILRIEDFDSTIYIYRNNAPFIRIELEATNGSVYTSGKVYDASMQLAGTFSEMEVEKKGKVAVAQRDATLRLYSVCVKNNELENQTITFDPIGTKKVSDQPFVISASATSGLPVDFFIEKGPAIIHADTVFLTGEVGLVEIVATQSGNNVFSSASEVKQTFFVQADNGNTSSDLLNFNQNWVATDGAGRILPDFEESGPRKENKLVGVFYYLWQGHHGNKVYDITKIIAAYPQDPLSPDNPGWGPVNSFHFWSEPEEGYFKALDPWVIRRNLQMLSNADVDFIFFDVTNAVTYLPEILALCDMSVKMQSEGVQTPEIAFITNASSGKTMNGLYDNFYALGLYENLWFKWQGKPLILGKADDPDLRPEVKNFFTIKYSWAWTNTKNEPNHWQWLDSYPQDWGWSTDPKIPEQLSVSTAHHPSNPLGKSYSNGKQPAVDKDYLTDFTDLGLQFQEQWKRVFEVNPQVVMITQWNEWIAQRFIKEGDGNYAGKPIKSGDTYFVDVFNREFNRDMAPMKGGYTDNYYYQLVSNIRKFKGMDEPSPISAPNSISINGEFKDWENVSPVFKDPPGDIMHRNFPSYDPTVIYTNITGRNDIVESQTTYDAENIYFYVKAASGLTSYSDPNWMLLFIDADRNKFTGWEGYDYVVNLGVKSATTTTLKVWDGQNWGNEIVVPYQMSGNEMELSIPRTALSMDKTTPEFYFHWADNPQQLKNITSFFTDGESAPDRRFNYNFSSSKIQTSVQAKFKDLTIPDTVEFEDFDNGGVGVAYSDANIGNTGGSYRPSESVDIEAKTGGGFNIGWINTGEWLEYTVDVKAIGLFTAKIAYAANGEGKEAKMFIDDIDKTGIISFPSTGNLNTWAEKNVDLKLTMGKHILKFYIQSAANDFKLDKVVFTEKDVVYPGNGTGLSKSFWKGSAPGTWFKDSICSEIDPVIDEVWEDVSPGCDIDKDFWNARWQGEIQALFSEEYTFYLTLNDLGRLWINNQLVVDKWTGGGAGNTFTGTITLTAGQKVPIVVDFAEKVGDARIKLEWSSSSNSQEVVPQSQLYPAILTVSEKNMLKSSIQVYPNPTNDFIRIETNMNNWDYNLIDTIGRVIISTTSVVGNQQTVDIAKLKSGFYILNVTDSKETISIRIIKK